MMPGMLTSSGSGNPLRKVIHDRPLKYQRMMTVDLESDFFVEYLEYVDALVGDDETFVACAALDHHETPQPVHPARCVWLPFSYVISSRTAVASDARLLGVCASATEDGPEGRRRTLGGGFPLELTIFPIRWDCDEPLGDAGAGRPP